MSPLLGVEINEKPALQITRCQSARTVHAGFLIHGEQHFQRRTGKARLPQRGQRQCHADAVIRAQRGLRRHHPAIAHCHCDGIAPEIVYGSRIGLTNHVEMPLQDHPGGGFISPTSRFF